MYARNSVTITAMRRTKEDALLTKEKLLDTAELLFADQGVSQTSLQKIAQAAGVTRGAIYWHFKDKAALFNAMMERTTLPMEETIHRVGTDRSDTPLDQVRASVLDALNRIVTEPHTRRVFDIALHKVEYIEELSDVRAPPERAPGLPRPHRIGVETCPVTRATGPSAQCARHDRGPAGPH